MKCDTCVYQKMCHLSKRYMDVIVLIADLTDTGEPEYSRACKSMTGLFDGCVNYEEAS